MTVPKEGVISNIGNNYNPTTGQYTAPYDGIYVFGLHIYKSEFATKTVVCSIRRNEQKVVAAYVPGVVELHEGSTAVVVHLNKNDIVDVGDCNDIDELENFTAFFGYLLKAD